MISATGKQEPHEKRVVDFSQTPIDDFALLAKYIAHVDCEEGVTFIDFIHSSQIKLSPEEIARLEEAEIEAEIIAAEARGLRIAARP